MDIYHNYTIYDIDTIEYIYIYIDTRQYIITIYYNYIPQKLMIASGSDLPPPSLPSVHCIMACNFHPGEAVKVGMHFVRSPRHAGAGHQRPSGHLVVGRGHRVACHG